MMALAGILGVSASQLIWIDSVKHELMLLSLAACGYGLYRAYSTPADQSCCPSSSEDKRASMSPRSEVMARFFQSKGFLWAVTIVTLVILALPYIGGL